MAIEIRARIAGQSWLRLAFESSGGKSLKEGYEIFPIYWYTFDKQTQP
ncbi:MAG TPA: hypothetical protein VN729_05660 [Ktedonobacteraceae bacterium]|jgi:hypothetical protein|nr:hypothetical protein [Ktedonobacteraceae bacterium]